MGKIVAQRASIIFDLDGTLVDSAKDIQWVANTALSEIGVAPISYEEAVSFIGEGAPLFVKQMIAARSVKTCLLYTSPSPRDAHESRMPSSA